MTTTKADNDARGTDTGDVVLREVWRAKDALAAASGYDLDKFIAGVREREKCSGHRVVNLQRKREPTASKPAG